MNRGERELRVIGGRLRGRRWRFPDAPGLRPTPDRVRETLFNWLQMRIGGARCLDAFAGSGALGIEALSRGASEVVFVESNAHAAAELRSTLDRFGIADEGRVRVEEVPRALQALVGPFDVVFVDPPFAAGLLAPTLEALARQDLLADEAFVYAEMPVDEAVPPLPPGWVPHREGRAGEVGYHLFSVSPRRAAAPLPKGVP
jgi:16S rRNA (guanine966-N2)-methyltransferase